MSTEKSMSEKSMCCSPMSTHQIEFSILHIMQLTILGEKRLDIDTAVFDSTLIVEKLFSYPTPIINTITIFNILARILLTYIYFDLAYYYNVGDTYIVYGAAVFIFS